MASSPWSSTVQQTEFSPTRPQTARLLQRNLSNRRECCCALQQRPRVGAETASQQHNTATSDGCEQLAHTVAQCGPQHCCQQPPGVYKRPCGNATLDPNAGATRVANKERTKAHNAVCKQRAALQRGAHTAGTNSSPSRRQWIGQR